jgi:GT2 family glycosyltransferase
VPDLGVELLLVDNGSSDGTDDILRQFSWNGVVVRRIGVPTPGLARAQNVGLTHVTGRAVLFLDDDVRPPADWITGLSAPILDGTADAVGGGVRIAAEVKPDWLRPEHEEWFASTEHWEPTRPPVLVGASMAIGRHVFAAIGGFDEDLPQAMDTAYSYRLLRSGFRLMLRHDVVTSHHVRPSRFSREGIRRQATLRAEAEAFLLHHFGGVAPPFTHGREWWAKYRLARAARASATAEEDISLAEMRLMQRAEFWRAYRRLRRTEPRYAGPSRVQFPIRD